MRTHLCGRLRRGRRRRDGDRVRLGGQAAASTASTWPSSTSATTPGIVQCVVAGTVDVRSEYVVRVEGTVRHRPEGTVNPELPTGEVELGDCTVEVLDRAEPPPFAVDDRVEVDEARPAALPVRRPAPAPHAGQPAAAGRGQRAPCGRPWSARGSARSRRPLLWAPTPEGAREFAVPVAAAPRLVLRPAPEPAAGQAAAHGGGHRPLLPDRPVPARRGPPCRPAVRVHPARRRGVVRRRQEDVLGVRRPRRSLDAAEAVTGERPAGLARMTWAEAIDRFGTDKPDLRFGMELVDLSAVFAGTGVQGLRRAVREGDRARGRGDARPRRGSTRSPIGPRRSAPRAWPGSGCSSAATGAGRSRLAPRPVPVRRRARPAARRRPRGDSRGPGAGGGRRVPATACSGARRSCGWSSGARPVSEGRYRYLWVVDFPLFDGVDDDGPTRSPPTTPSPCPTPTTSTGSSRDPASVRSQAYDLVLNGWELGSGSVRIHRADIQRRVFDVLGHRRGGGRGPLRVPARRLPLRRAAPRRLRRGHRPAGRHLRRRGQHPRGHRLPEDPVGRRPHDRRPEAARPGARCAELGLRAVRARTAGRHAVGRRRPVRRGGRRAPGASGRPLAARLRPRTLDEIVGQRHLRGARRAPAGADRVGPARPRPSCGARPARARPRWPRSSPAATAKAFVPLSAVSAGVKDVREVVEGARPAARRAGPGHDPLPRRGPPLQPAPSRTPCCPRWRRACWCSSAPPPRTRSSRSTPRCSCRSTLWRLEPLAETS